MNTTHQQINNNQTAGFPCTHGSPKSNVTGKTTDSKILRGFNMFNKTNVLKIGLVLGIAIFVTGCATVNSASSVVINNSDKTGVIYGAAASQEGVVSTSDVCKAINNRDSRCTNVENYVVVKVFSKFGFADGAVGTIALVEKDFPYLSKLKFTGRLGDKNEPYVKAKITPGKLGEILEIVSTDGDGKCQWSGLPRVGGTVCPAYNWDYRSDNQAAIVLN